MPGPPCPAPRSSSLGPGASGAIAVTVDIPWAGGADTAVVTALGQANGGTDTATLTTTGSAAGFWEQIATEPDNGRMDNVSAGWGGQVWSITGYGANLNVRSYDPATNVWTTVGTPAPFGGNYAHSGCQAGSKVYMYGDASTTGFTGLWSYDMAATTWAQETPGGAPPATTGIWAPAWAYDAETGICYLTGGATVAGAGTLTTVYAYDTAANAWLAPLPNFTTVRDFHAAWVFTDNTARKLLCVAGGNSTSGSIASTQCYDFAAGAWGAENADMGALPADLWGMGYTRKVHAGVTQLWVTGGVRAAVITTATSVFDVAAGAWADDGSLPAGAVYRTSATVLDNDLYTVGGSIGSFTYTGLANHHVQCPFCEPVVGVDFTWDPTAPFVGDTVTFTGSAMGTEPLTYDWTFGDGGTANVNPADHTYAAPGDYLVTLNVSNACSEAEAEHTVTVAEVVPPNIDVNPSSLAATQYPDTTTSQTLNIGNTGGSDLNWEITEEPLNLGAVQVNLPARPAQPAGMAATGHTPARPAGSYTIQRRSGVNALPNVLLVHSDNNANTIQALLQAYGDLGTVSLYDGRIGTPTLAELLAYDVVLTWSNYVYADSVGMGNVLADYVDAGGKVVNLNFAMGTHGWQMGGRFMTEGYTAMDGGGLYFGTVCLGAYNPAHPIMAGVTNVCEYYRMLGTYLTAASTEVAQWSDGQSFVAVKDNRTVVSINGYVGSDYQWSGQMPDVVHNAILWLAGTCVTPADVPWLSENPISGTTAAGASTPVQVTFDSTGLAVGAYNANLCVASNDPDDGPGNGTELVVVPVELIVTEPPAASIDLVKTVGAVPGVCATTDSIIVEQGTEVYYCYQVENTGNVTFNFHDLVDSELGTLLNDFPYTLAPGAFSPQVIVPATPLGSVTNSATWTTMTALAGYVADDTIPYNWQDIANTGTQVSLSDDSMSGAIPLGFAFDYFGVIYSDIYISSNGFLTVLPGQSNGCCTGYPIPDPTSPNGVIAGWWEDLNLSGGGAVHTQTLGVAPNRVFIVQFTNVPHYSTGNEVSMQFKLFEGSNAIEVHYQAAPVGWRHAFGRHRKCRWHGWRPVLPWHGRADDPAGGALCAVAGRERLRHRHGHRDDCGAQYRCRPAEPAG